MEDQMPIDPRNVVTGSGRRGGYIFKAPVGTPLPTDATTALTSELVNMGAASSDGFTKSIEKSYEIIRDQRGDEMIRPRTELSVTASFALIESMNGDVAKACFGEDAVTIVPGTESEGEQGTIVFKGDETDPAVWVLDLAYGRGLRRYVFPDAQMVTESFERELVNSQEIRFPVELTMRPDESGAYFIEMWSNGYKRVAA